MKHLIQHDLDAATAHRVIDRAFAEYRARYAAYEPQLRWVGERRAELGMKAKGLRLNGAMSIEEGGIAVELDVPLLLSPFRKRAIEVIEREVKLWLGKARAGEA